MISQYRLSYRSIFYINNSLFIALWVLRDIRQKPSGTSYIPSYLHGSIYILVRIIVDFIILCCFFFITQYNSIHFFFINTGLGRGHSSYRAHPLELPHKSSIYHLYNICKNNTIPQVFIISELGIIGTKSERCGQSDLSIIVIYYNSLSFAVSILYRQKKIRPLLCTKL